MAPPARLAPLGLPAAKMRAKRRAAALLEPTFACVCVCVCGSLAAITEIRPRVDGFSVIAEIVRDGLGWMSLTQRHLSTKCGSLAAITEIRPRVDGFSVIAEIVRDGSGLDESDTVTSLNQVRFS